MQRSGIWEPTEPWTSLRSIQATSLSCCVYTLQIFLVAVHAVDIMFQINLKTVFSLSGCEILSAMHIIRFIQRTETARMGAQRSISNNIHIDSRQKGIIHY